MTGVVAAAAGRVPAQCQVRRCRGHGCAVSMKGLPQARVIINLDCPALELGNAKRCDFVVIVERDDGARVAAIELKRGSFDTSQVVKQLQGGACYAETLEAVVATRFDPVLAHGKRVHKTKLRALRSKRVAYRGCPRRIVLRRCGEPLAL